MLKKIKVTGFKGKLLDEIELKPITLLFGPNSAGKSSVIQVIHYLKEILDRRNYSPRGTKLGGNAIDLGGFKNFVFNHELRNLIILDLEFDLSNKDLPGAQEVENRSDEFDTFSSFSSKVNSASLTIHIRWIEKLNRAEATFYSIDINEDHFISISLDYDNPKNLHSYISEINFFHERIIDINAFSYQPEMFVEAIGLDSEMLENDNFRIDLKDNSSVIPDFNKEFIFDANVGSLKDLDWFDDVKVSMDLQRNAKGILAVLQKVTWSVGKLAQEELERFRYIGPIRDIPPRNFDPHFEDEIERWSNGLAAWDLILNKKVDFKLLNEWLKKLKINYRFEQKKELRSLTPDELKSLLHNSEEEIVQQVRQLFEGVDLDVPLFQNSLEFNIYKEFKDGFDKFNKSLNKKIDDNSIWALFENNLKVEVKPYDVGIGISQILPIIVAVLTQKNPILAIEQPELHIHPALQVELADLFIDGINKNPEAIYLIETHSEHFILRLLRRIEETTKNKVKEKNLELVKEKVGVYYIDVNAQFGGLKKLPIDDTGEFTEDWPGGFFEERAEELFPDD